jgi:AAA domain
VQLWQAEGVASVSGFASRGELETNDAFDAIHNVGRTIPNFDWTTTSSNSSGGDESVDDDAADELDHRRIVLTPASSIKMKRARWLWRGRIPLGELSLFAGREDLGKSTICYTFAAWITRGTMKGEYLGTPKAVLVAATEDSWEYTVVPRLAAAGADLDLVYRVEVVTAEGFGGYLSLPDDLPALDAKVRETGAVLLLLDPLMSRLSSRIDSHKDQDVRQALEPLVSFLQCSNIAGLGLIHLNKGTSSDTLSSIMASRAFVAVARAVLYAIKDPNDGSRRLLGNEKNNLGQGDLPTFSYTIEGCHVGDDDEGKEIWTAKIVWGDESELSISETIAAASEDADDGMTAVGDAVDWLQDYLSMAGDDGKESSIVKDAGKVAGHSRRAIERAAAKLKVEFSSAGFPRKTVWILPVASRRPVPV